MRFLVLIGWIAAAVTPQLAAAQRVAESDGGIVVAGSEEATEAGLRVLSAGGSAMDAAVAVSLTLGATEPYGSGVGGKLILLHFDAKTGRTQCVEALDAAPAALTTEAAQAMSPDERRTGFRAACVPGLLAGLEAAHERWGRLAWKDVVAPAIAAAEGGFTVTPESAGIFRIGAARLREQPEAARLLLIDGESPKVGDRLRNPELAAAYRLIARDGAAAFYRGAIGRRLVEAVRAGGGVMTMADLANYRARFPRPLVGRYADADIHTSPAPLMGGATLLASLLAMESWGDAWPGRGPLDEDHLDALGRVLRSVYPAMARAAGDVPDSPGRIAEALSPGSVRGYVREAQTATIGTSTDESAWLPAIDDPRELQLALADDRDASTTHFVIIDRDGNTVSATQSISHRFGAAVVVPGTGILLNNCMTNFAFRSASSPNLIAGGKRPRSTMTPTIVVRDGRVVLALGSPAGQRIPTGVLQVLVSVLHFDVPLADAVEQPRFHVRRPLSRQEPDNAMDLEGDAPAELDAVLSARGWQVERFARERFYFGGVNAVAVDSEGRRVGVADPRRTNVAGGD